MMDLDELDIYDDLDDFQKTEEKKISDLQYQALETKYNESIKTIETLKLELKDSKKKNKQIEINFQNLLDTAKAEIRRKDKLLDEVRKEKDDICFRRKFPKQAGGYQQQQQQWQREDSAEHTNPFREKFATKTTTASSTVEYSELPNLFVANESQTADSSNGKLPERESTHEAKDRKRHGSREIESRQRYRSHEAEGRQQNRSRDFRQHKHHDDADHGYKYDAHARGKRNFAADKEEHSSSSSRDYKHEHSHDRNDRDRKERDLQQEKPREGRDRHTDIKRQKAKEEKRSTSLDEYYKKEKRDSADKDREISNISSNTMKRERSKEGQCESLMNQVKSRSSSKEEIITGRRENNDDSKVKKSGSSMKMISEQATNSNSCEEAKQNNFILCTKAMKEPRKIDEIVKANGSLALKTDELPLICAENAETKTTNATKILEKYCIGLLTLPAFDVDDLKKKTNGNINHQKNVKSSSPTKPDLPQNFLWQSDSSAAKTTPDGDNNEKINAKQEDLRSKDLEVAGERVEMKEMKLFESVLGYSTSHSSSTTNSTITSSESVWSEKKKPESADNENSEKPAINENMPKVMHKSTTIKQCTPKNVKHSELFIALFGKTPSSAESVSSEQTRLAAHKLGKEKIEVSSADLTSTPDVDINRNKQLMEENRLSYAEINKYFVENKDVKLERDDIQNTITKSMCSSLRKSHIELLLAHEHEAIETEDDIDIHNSEDEQNLNTGKVEAMRKPINVANDNVLIATVIKQNSSKFDNLSLELIDSPGKLFKSHEEKNIIIEEKSVKEHQQQHCSVGAMIYSPAEQINSSEIEKSKQDLSNSASDDDADTDESADAMNSQHNLQSNKRSPIVILENIRLPTIYEIRMNARLSLVQKNLKDKKKRDSALKNNIIDSIDITDDDDGSNRPRDNINLNSTESAGYVEENKVNGIAQSQEEQCKLIIETAGDAKGAKSHLDPRIDEKEIQPEVKVNEDKSKVDEKEAQVYEGEVFEKETHFKAEEEKEDPKETHKENVVHKEGIQSTKMNANTKCVTEGEEDKCRTQAQEREMQAVESETKAKKGEIQAESSEIHAELSAKEMQGKQVKSEKMVRQIQEEERLIKTKEREIQAVESKIQAKQIEAKQKEREIKSKLSQILVKVSAYQSEVQRETQADEVVETQARENKEKEVHQAKEMEQQEEEEETAERSKENNAQNKETEALAITRETQANEPQGQMKEIKTQSIKKETIETELIQKKSIENEKQELETQTNIATPIQTGLSEIQRILKDNSAPKKKTDETQLIQRESQTVEIKYTTKEAETKERVAGAYEKQAEEKQEENKMQERETLTNDSETKEKSKAEEREMQAAEKEKSKKSTTSKIQMRRESLDIRKHNEMQEREAQAEKVRDIQHNKVQETQKKPCPSKMQRDKKNLDIRQHVKIAQAQSIKDIRQSKVQERKNKSDEEETQKKPSISKIQRRRESLDIRIYNRKQEKGTQPQKLKDTHPKQIENQAKEEVKIQMEKKGSQAIGKKSNEHFEKMEKKDFFLEKNEILAKEQEKDTDEKKSQAKKRINQMNLLGESKQTAVVQQRELRKLSLDEDNFNVQRIKMRKLSLDEEISKNLKINKRKNVAKISANLAKYKIPKMSKTKMLEHGKNTTHVDDCVAKNDNKIKMQNKETLEKRNAEDHAIEEQQTSGNSKKCIENVEKNDVLSFTENKKMQQIYERAPTSSIPSSRSSSSMSATAYKTVEEVGAAAATGAKVDKELEIAIQQLRELQNNTCKKSIINTTSTEDDGTSNNAVEFINISFNQDKTQQQTAVAVVGKTIKNKSSTDKTKDYIGIKTVSKIVTGNVDSFKGKDTVNNIKKVAKPNRTHFSQKNSDQIISEERKEDDDHLTVNTEEIEAVIMPTIDESSMQKRRIPKLKTKKRRILDTSSDEEYAVVQPSLAEQPSLKRVAYEKKDDSKDFLNNSLLRLSSDLTSDMNTAVHELIQAVDQKQTLMPVDKPLQHEQTDEKFKEIDSNLYLIFESPDHKLDVSTLSELNDFNISQSPLTTSAKVETETTATDATIEETANASKLLQQSCNSSINDSNASMETKHMSLGSSDYRFERVNENVVNLFISRKRRRGGKKQ